jgi:hypothetical protein
MVVDHKRPRRDVHHRRLQGDGRPWQREHPPESWKPLQTE